MGTGKGAGSAGVRLRFRKSGTARFLSQKDLVRIFERALRRAGLPLTYTRGFNPHPRLRIRPAIALGACAGSAAAEVALSDSVPPDELTGRLNLRMVHGISILASVPLASTRAAPLIRVLWRFAPRSRRNARRTPDPLSLPSGIEWEWSDRGDLLVTMKAEKGREPPGARALAAAFFGDPSFRRLYEVEMVRVDFQDGL